MPHGIKISVQKKQKIQSLGERPKVYLQFGESSTYKKMIDLGFWDKDGNYIEDYQEVDEKELNHQE